LQDRQIPLTIVTQPEIGATADDSFLLNLMAAFAEFEQEMTRERLADARAALKRRGRRVAGVVPYGYTRDPDTKQLVPVPKEAKRVVKIFDMAAQGMTAREIAEIANRRRWRTSRGGHWTPRQVLEQLANAVYMGRIRDGDDTLPGIHRAIVSKERFREVRSQVDSRRTSRRARDSWNADCPLRGVLFCGRCGRVMSPSSSHHGSLIHRYYRCRSHVGGRPPCKGVAAGDMNFALLGDAEVFAKIPGFQAIPLEKIGLYADEFRSTLPLRAPRIRPDGGPFVRAVRVTVESGGDAEIRYTLDGTEPTRSSQQYAGSIDLADTATLMAVAFPKKDPAAWPFPTAEARFVRLEFGRGKGVFLSDLDPADVFSHGGLKSDKNYQGNGPVKLGGRVYRKAIMICPEKDGELMRAHVTYDLRGALQAATRFKAIVGIDDAADARGTVTFKVEVFRDRTWHTLFESGILGWGPDAERPVVDVDIQGTQRLRLSVDGGPTIYADHAVWADARLE